MYAAQGRDPGWFESIPTLYSGSSDLSGSFDYLFKSCSLVVLGSRCEVSNL